MNVMKKTRRRKPGTEQAEVILLQDLAPRGDVQGGAGKILFGERLDDAAPASERARPDQRSGDARQRRKS
jgi:hypothetical protein